MKFGGIPANGKFGQSPEIGTGDSAIVQGPSKSENGKDDMAKQPTKPHRKMITKIT